MGETLVGQVSAASKVNPGRVCEKDTDFEAVAPTFDQTGNLTALSIVTCKIDSIWAVAVGPGPGGNRGASVAMSSFRGKLQYNLDLKTGLLTYNHEMIDQIPPHMTVTENAQGGGYITSKASSKPVYKSWVGKLLAGVETYQQRTAKILQPQAKAALASAIAQLRAHYKSL